MDVSQFEVVHTEPVHLFVIDPDFKDYHHEHPIQIKKGQFKFSFIPQISCSYRL